ncbi:MAG: tetratricopeptide repeat protein [Chitinophagaceae bacterium]
MKKQQLILLGSGGLLFCLIFFFGTTLPPKTKASPTNATAAASPSGQITFSTILNASKSQLSPAQQGYVSQLETAVVRGDVKTQQIKVYRQLAAFWRDSAHLLLPYSHYMGEAAKLENSEKSLTFAAHFLLDGLRRQNDLAVKKWMATEAQELFEKALKINALNDSSKIGLGACFLFGQISENPMMGIQMIREVADRDPRNMYAQFILGLGGLESGQFDKAIERLSKVVTRQPDNIEATVGLAEAYERKGDKIQAIQWYEASKKFFANDTEILQEIDARINLLKK